ncbi:MAG: hydrolase [Nocardioidaceae bacterium]|nr:hydrolase [Nocardioidaceae bacterium]
MSSRDQRVPTPQGDARVVTYPAERPWASCLLSHGASGGVDAPDLQLAARLLPANGVEVLLVEQPWRVAGRRSASPPPRLDEAFTAIVEQVAPRFPYVVGGRSAGARVGCRTGRLLGAVGVLALSFPLHPPGRPERSRLGELLGAGLPVLVVQGTRDAFGSAEDVRSAVGSNAPELTVVAIDGGDHGFAVPARDGGRAARDARLAAALDQAVGWLRTHVPEAFGNT